MNVERYIFTQGVKLKDNSIIPICDERIVIEESQDYSNYITIKGMPHEEIHYIEECIFDLMTKTISSGISLDYYEDNKANGGFTIGESVMYEKSSRLLKEAKIIDIVFENFNLYIRKGNNIEHGYKSFFKDIQFDDKVIYAIKCWNPSFILDDGTKINHYTNLFHKAV